MSGTGKTSSSVAERIRDKIAQEHYPAGYRMGSIRSLAQEYGVSSRTVAKAVTLLIQEGTLRSEMRRGLFVDQTGKNTSVIGYAGTLPHPDPPDPLLNEAVTVLCDTLMQSGCENCVITHRELHDPRMGALRLKKLDALLFCATFLDPVIEQLLFSYSKKLVIVGASYILDSFPASQVIPELFPALEKFNARFPFWKYRKILMLKATHPNADGIFRQIENYMVRLGIREKFEVFTFEGVSNSTASLAAYKYFAAARKEDFDDVLVLSGSDYFSVGIYEAGKVNHWMPEVLSVDNLEGLLPQLAAPEPYFTSIDWKLVQCFKASAELALRLVREQDPDNYVIRIPADVVFRKSVHKK